MDTNWNSLSAEQRAEHRFGQWVSPEGAEFASPEAEAAYKARTTRLKAAIQLTSPDRVPVFPFAGFLPAYYCGYTVHDMMYDYDKLVDAWHRYNLDFEPDAYFGSFIAGPGRVFELLDYKLYQWPGHGVAANHSYQCVEAEYMKPEDYDQLIADPTDFWLRTYLPRIAGTLTPFAMLAPMPEIVELPFMGANMVPYGLPPVQAALEKLIEVGRESLRWAEAVGRSDQGLRTAGFPSGAGGASKAPFDVIGDTLRGTRGIMMDIYRRPETLLRALDHLVPFMVRMGVSGATFNRNPIVFIPLHKGADGFLSDEQFRTFYWPTLRKVIVGLVEEGLVPFLFAEGGYNSRLEHIRDVPRGKVIWYFDYTDMARAKEVLGDTACIMGNVPIALLSTGSPDQITAYCKNLIAVAGKGGGFILSSGAVIDQAQPENIRAMINSAKEFGLYG